MAKGEQQKKTSAKQTEDAPEAKASSEVAEKAEEIKDDLDELLDEIDDVLEQNAEEFVRSFVQKGGE